jgi:HK97 family phage major capsid protein
MSDRLKELREKRARIVTSMREITDKATAEKRDMNAEEVKKHGDLFTEQETVAGNITAEERTLELAREQAQRDADASRHQRRDVPDPDAEKRTLDLLAKVGISMPKAWSAAQDNRAMVAFRSWLASGTRMPDLSGDGGKELRALQAGDEVTGGNTVAPLQFVAQLIQGVDNLVFIRQKATKFRVATAAGMGAPSLDNDVDDADWTVELKTGNEDAGLKFGKRELHPRPLAKRIKVSKTLAADLDAAGRGHRHAAPGVQVRRHRREGVHDRHGANQPLGVFTASNDGIPTSRDISAGNTATSPTFDGLMAAKYALKGQYWSKAEWMFHRDGMLKISQLKDLNGQYIWQQSVQAGQPDKILKCRCRCRNTFRTPSRPASTSASSATSPTTGSPTRWTCRCSASPSCMPRPTRTASSAERKPTACRCWPRPSSA